MLYAAFYKSFPCRIYNPPFLFPPFSSYFLYFLFPTFSSSFRPLFPFPISFAFFSYFIRKLTSLNADKNGEYARVWFGDESLEPLNPTHSSSKSVSQSRKRKRRVLGFGLGFSLKSYWEIEGERSGFSFLSTSDLGILLFRCRWVHTPFPSLFLLFSWIYVHVFFFSL